MTSRMMRALTVGLLGLGLGFASGSSSPAGSEMGPTMDEERMSRMMKMMTEMQGQMREMQSQMQGMGAMHGQMGQMMSQMGQMRGMMQQHQREMVQHCPMGQPTAPKP
jgi:hypothetical protein